jgi:uncharacterized membrane protein
VTELAPSQLPDYQITQLPDSEIGGCLLVLCGLLLICQPISTGLVVSSVLGSLAIRGFPMAMIMLLRILATGFGIAAGLALLARRPGAVAIARLSLVASAVTDLIVYLTPYFPSNRAPGETPLYVLASLTYCAVWMIYLIRSKRVHRTFQDA